MSGRSDPLDLFWDCCEGPIAYGVNDCCMVVADVVVASGRSDLMAGYRGRYATARGFVRAFRRGGHEALPDACEAAFAEHGGQVQAPADFDVAVVQYPHAGKIVASPAFFYGGFWHLRSEAGGMVLSHDTFEGDPKLFRIN